MVTGLTEAEKQHCFKHNGKEEKLGKDTKKLMEAKRKLTDEGETNFKSFKRLNKDISKVVRKDMRTYDTKVGTKVIEENRSLKFLRQKMAHGGNKLLQNNNHKRKNSNK